MNRLRHRPDYFVYRGDRFAFHRLQDGATLARLDPYAAGEQVWPLHSRRTISVTAEEIRDITFQVHGLQLPDTRPASDWDEARIQAIEERLAALETSSNLVERESVQKQPDPEDTDLVKSLLARISELESREPEIREVEKIVERVVEVPAAVVEAEAPEPYTPDFTLIPDALARFAAADETAADFRARLKSLWQRFGIEDGKNFPGGGEPLTGAEKITMREIDIVLNSDEGANAGLLTWLLAEERA